MKQPILRSVSIILPCILVGLLLILLARSCSRTPVQDAADHFHTELQWQLLTVTQPLPKGATVVLMDLQYKGFETNTQHRTKRLSRALNNAGFTVLHAEHLLWDEDNGYRPHEQGFPYAEFLRMAREYPGADAVISLCGAPYTLDNPKKPGDSVLPKLFLTNVPAWSPSLQRYLEDGRISAAAYLREDAPGVYAKVDDLRQKYTVVHRAQVD